MNKKILRKLGFKSDQEGIINRYINEDGGWESHLKNTKDFILKAVENSEKSSVAVFGSGWWLDLPTEELCKMFDKVYFVDILHPSQIKKKALDYKNLTLIEADITGFAENLYFHVKKNKNKSLSELEAKNPFADFPSDYFPDFTISLNILNQLDILLLSYLEKKCNYEKNEIDNFRKRIQENHIKMLPASKSCLISDCVEINYDKDNNKTAEKDLIYTELPAKKADKEWIWNFDTSGKYREGLKIRFLVKAFSSF